MDATATPHPGPFVGAIPRPSSRLLAALALVGANAFWGTSFVATKPVLAHVPPLTLAFVRFAIVLAILWPLVARSGHRPRLDGTTAKLGFTGVFCFYATQNVGLGLTTATNAALIQEGIPVLTALLAAAFLGERLRPVHLLGIGLSLAALAAIVGGGAGFEARLAWRGDALLAASALSFAAYLVLGRRAFARGPVLTTLTGSIVWGLLFLVPVVAVELGTTGLGAVTPRDGALVLYLGATCSAGAFLLWSYALRHLEAGRAAVFGSLSPLVGGVAGALLGEALSPAVLLGGPLLLAGVWLANRPAPPPRGAAPTNPGAIDTPRQTTGSGSRPDLAYTGGAA